MKLPEHERQAHRDAFRAMSLGGKLEYIFAYYKLPIVLLSIALIAAASVLHGMMTHKDVLLYVAYANLAPGDELDATLSSGFTTHMGANDRTSEVLIYRDLYLSDAEGSVDHQYSYASRLKLLASVDAEQLDVVLMNRDAYDLLSHSGYLLDLTEAEDLSPQLREHLVSNDVILEDNELELQLNEAETYEATTERVANALYISELPAFSTLSGDVYLGIIANTPRLDTALRYIDYLYEADAPSA